MEVARFLLKAGVDKDINGSFWKQGSSLHCAAHYTIPEAPRKGPPGIGNLKTPKPLLSPLCKKTEGSKLVAFSGRAGRRAVHGLVSCISQWAHGDGALVAGSWC